MTTLTVQVLPVSDTRPEIEVIGDKMTWMAFHDYFGSDLPQALRIEEVLDQTQEELREGVLWEELREGVLWEELREGMLCVQTPAMEVLCEMFRCSRLQHI